MTEVLVQAQALTKDYPAPDGGWIPVLAAVRCQVQAGDKIAVIGASGSGKSTLLHILGGLIPPTSGHITWPALGEPAQLLPEKLQFVFQSVSLFPALTVLSNVALPLVLANRAQGAEDKALAMLEYFGLADLAQKLPEELSGGQAQRVAMVRALTTAPRLILSDEPTGQLDSATASRFLDQTLHQVAAMGIAIVIATHDPAMAARMDQQWTISRGRLSAGDMMAEVAQ